MDQASPMHQGNMHEPCGEHCNSCQRTRPLQTALLGQQKNPRHASKDRDFGSDGRGVFEGPLESH